MHHTHDDLHSASRRDYIALVLAHRTHLILSLIVLIGLVPRVWWMTHEAAVVASDGAEYARMAEHLFHDNALIGNFDGPEIIYAPLYPVLIAGTMVLIPNSETAAHAVSLVAGIATVILIFLIADYMYGRRTGYVCAFLASVHPLLVALSGTVYNEALYVAGFMAVVYCGLRALELRRRRDCLALGICLGLAYLTRVEAFVYVLFFLVALLVAGVLRKRVRSAVVGSVIVVAAFGILASPYVAFFYNHTGSVRLEAKFDMNYTQARNRLAGMNGIEAEYSIASDGTAKGPMLAPSEFADGTPYPHRLVDKLWTLAAMAKYNASSIYNYFTYTAIGSPVLLGLVALGLFGQPWSTRRTVCEIVVVAMAASIVLIVAASPAGEFRYFLPIVPLLLLWAGKGLGVLRQWILHWEFLRGKRAFQQTLFASALPLGALVTMLAAAVYGIGITKTAFYWEHSTAAIAERDAALWLQRYDPGPKLIAVRAAVFPYYAKGTLINLPFGDSQATIRYLDRRKVDFVVLESLFLQPLPMLAKWLADGIPDPRAQVIYDKTNTSGERVVIYRWQPG
jgi:4-amino-4-deoxy-L-arabinose transferase-like glycosyltransferase